MNFPRPSKSLSMAKVKSSGSKIERVLGSAMWAAGIRYRKQYRKIPGKPDFAMPGKKIAVFCDSSFWHGRGWPAAAAAFKTNREFWIPKIEKNIQRDREVNALLHNLGWAVIRFWDDEILKHVDDCVFKVFQEIKIQKSKNVKNRSN